MINFLFIFGLILLNGFFAAAEMAFVVARNARLQTFVDEGSKSAEITLQQKESPGSFLAMVQVGITLVATFASALGGANLTNELAPVIGEIPALAPYAPQVALGLVVLMITFLSLIFGELVPKQLALRDPDRFIMRIIRPLTLLTRVLQIPIRVLDATTQLVLRLLGQGEASEPSTTEQEIAVLANEAAAEGNIEVAEGLLISKIFAYTDTRVADVMTARPNMVSLSADSTLQSTIDIIAEHGYSRYPLMDGPDKVLGYIHVKDLLGLRLTDPIRGHARTVLTLPATMHLPSAFNIMQKSEVHLAVVVDEFGGVIGVVSMEDLIEEILGEIEDEHDETEPVMRREGEWEVDGAMSLLDVNQMLNSEFETSSHYTTLAGYFLEQHGQLPEEGDVISADSYTLTVAQMLGNRIARICVRSEEPPADEA